MSQNMVTQQYPRIYSNSIEHSKVTSNINNQQVTKQKRYFKFFVINNKITPLATGTTSPVYWGVKDANVLDRDIETYMDRPITFTPTGTHPDPARAGIYETNYKNKLDFVKATVDYYNKFAKGKIINMYKPNRSVLEAAIKDPNVTVTYEGLGETTDPDFIAMLDENEKNDKQIFVSPGVVSTDSTTDANGNIIVNGFVGTHLAVVDEPAHTRPIAYVKKETCNVDGHTCYFKLLTASELVNLNNNMSNLNNMADQAQTITSSNMSVTDDINKAGKVSDQEINHVKIDTEVRNANGDLVGKNLKEETETKRTEKNNTNVSDKEGDGNQENSKKNRDRKSSEREQSKEDSKDERVTISKSDLQSLLNDYKTEILNEVENKQNQKLEASTKLSLVNTFIPKSEQTQPDYDFYNSLPVSSEQLKKILEDSKFNVNKDKRRSTNILAASSLTASTYKEEQRSNSPNDIHYIPSGQFIPSRYNL